MKAVTFSGFFLTKPYACVKLCNAQYCYHFKVYSMILFIMSDLLIAKAIIYQAHKCSFFSTQTKILLLFKNKLTSQKLTISCEPYSHFQYNCFYFILCFNTYHSLLYQMHVQHFRTVTVVPSFIFCFVKTHQNCVVYKLIPFKTSCKMFFIYHGKNKSVHIIHIIHLCT